MAWELAAAACPGSPPIAGTMIGACGIKTAHTTLPAICSLLPATGLGDLESTAALNFMGLSGSFADKAGSFRPFNEPLKQRVDRRFFPPSASSTCDQAAKPNR
jgi:hypothetical protein